MGRDESESHHITQLEDNTAATRLGRSGCLLGGLAGRLGVLLNTTGGGGSLGSGLTTTAGRATATSGALVLEDLVERLAELSRHDEVGEEWRRMDLWL